MARCASIDLEEQRYVGHESAMKLVVRLTDSGARRSRVALRESGVLKGLRHPNSFADLLESLEVTDLGFTRTGGARYPGRDRPKHKVDFTF